MNAAWINAFLAAVFLGSAAGTAWADEYSDVNRLVRAGQLGEAIVKADQYLATKPRDPQMRFLKGVIQTESGKPADAIATFTQITQDYPELPEPYNNLAVLYAGQSQFDKARAALEMAIRTNPSYATAHENLGDVYAKLASQAYSKALQLDGSNSGVQPKLALIRTLFTADSKAQKAAIAPAATAPTPSTAQATVASATGRAPAASAAVEKRPVPVATPAAVPTTPSTPSASMASGGSDKDVEAAVRAWAQAWSAKDVSSYLASYSRDFKPTGGQSFKAWEQDRKARISGKSSISVKLEDLSVSVKDSVATARFKQNYSADSLNISSRKTLTFAKTGDRWAIVKESSGG